MCVTFVCFKALRAHTVLTFVSRLQSCAFRLCHVSSNVRSVCVTSPIMCVTFVSQGRSHPVVKFVSRLQSGALRLCHVSSHVRDHVLRWCEYASVLAEEDAKRRVRSRALKANEAAAPGHYCPIGAKRLSKQTIKKPTHPSQS
jgi:hypothetical protein